MQTSFTDQQRGDANIAEAEAIIRKCVHCGFCTATCPTYVTLGNELDSPRGRIYLIKEMLENNRPADEKTALHVDRCLSCLACTTTCPSGVDYMHLIDHARVHVEKTYKRPLLTRLQRSLLAYFIPDPKRFRLAMRLAALGRPFSGLMGRIGALKPFAAMLDLAPARLPEPLATSRPGLFPAPGSRKGRVAILSGCVQPVIDPAINDATIGLLNRLGIDVAISPDAGCCGSLVHHMGRDDEALRSARRNVDAWTKELDAEGLDAIIITTSGCGTTIKDYAHMLRNDPLYAEQAARISALAMDVTEYLATLDLPERPSTGLTVAYHSACSLQHGQKITLQPKALLRNAGFTVRDPVEGHLCCGSAGTYNMLHPDISEQLKVRKVKNLSALKPDIIAAGNIGCLTQIASGTTIPLVHTVELLNWAYGGGKPAKLAGIASSQ